jgi:hypothetical protein
MLVGWLVVVETFSLYCSVFCLGYVERSVVPLLLKENTSLQRLTSVTSTSCLGVDDGNDTNRIFRIFAFLSDEQ